MECEFWYDNIEVIAVIQSQLIELFEEYHGILTTQMTKEYGVADSTLRKAVARNDIQKYCRGIYFLDNFYFDDIYML
ncbi:hypothetical protein C7H83_07925 [Tetragenococcus halophilus]|uniref:AbiEi antitoxin N-terminal domain-containing protein n=1 Tax=Tetragenococcus halophilus TaxID=51669 RepID=A0A3G5FJ95_TETHA|nr:hypothetical protein C7H83_07925 [Tetragenococcus halophilus]QGP75478.1 hypothetical protein GLW17_00740 [Tetragenococcus halophilus]RQD32734.1 hypothetical protein C7K42_01940 [Tetragenococcus halophilus subsp. halophilus DSM 20339]